MNRHKLQSTAYRASARELQDNLDEEDRKWYVCRRTGRSYADLIVIAAESEGDLGKFCSAIGYKRLYRHNKYDDYGWWQTICAWMKQYIPQWEAYFRKTVKKLAEMPQSALDLPEQQQILEVVANALGMAPDALLNFAANQDTIETFMKANRAMLGNMAEAKLWSLVAQGDAATIRWLLPRIKQDAFGDKLANVPGDSPREIRIVESET